MKNLETIKAWYRLLEQKSIGVALAHRIIADIGDPVAYIGRQCELWHNITYISDESKAAFQRDTDPPHWQKIVHFLESSPLFQFITFFDPQYPTQLKNIYCPPLFLTAFGDVSTLQNTDIISIVGTRKPTHYGRAMTEKIVASLVANGIITCSGLALGIDATTHRHTLECGGVTIAVMACGLDTVYPPQNRELANQIYLSRPTCQAGGGGGVIISENMPCIPFEKYHFPQRNRIIAGLSQALVVIEGNLQSGAMSTAKFALDQNKEIYALPGDITKPQSAGPNSLIARGAKMILTPEDITADLKVDFQGTPITKQIDLTPEEQKIYDIIKLHSPEVHLDQLVIETQLSIGEISAIIFMLELKNAIKTTENNKYTINS